MTDGAGLCSCLCSSFIGHGVYNDNYKVPPLILIALSLNEALSEYFPNICHDNKGVRVAFFCQLFQVDNLLFCDYAKKHVLGVSGVHAGGGDAGDAAVQIGHEDPGQLVGFFGDDEGGFGEFQTVYQAVGDAGSQIDGNDGVEGHLDAEQVCAEQDDQGVQQPHDGGGAVVGQKVLDQGGDEVRAAGGGLDYEDKADAGTHDEAAVEG